MGILDSTLSPLLHRSDYQSVNKLYFETYILFYCDVFYGGFSWGTAAVALHPDCGSIDGDGDDSGASHPLVPLIGASDDVGGGGASVS